MTDTHSKYPECEKMSAVRAQSQVVGEFIEWVQGTKGYEFAQVPSYYDHTLVPVYINIENILAEFFGIDLQKVEAERREMLAEIRAVNECRDREAVDAEDACSGSPSSTDSQS